MLKEVSKEVEFGGKKYDLVFNLNVMQAIQKRYKTLAAWGALTDGTANDGETDIEALLFGVCEMLNEGIDIKNETAEKKEDFFTIKQVGRLMSDFGEKELTKAVNEVVIESAGAEKNA